MEIIVRLIHDSEVGAFRATMYRGFGEDIHDADQDSARFRKVVDVERCLAAFDGNDLVGTCLAIDFALTVPGGALPMAGTSMVTVRPTHRRRGVLRAMMKAHLAEIRGREEPLAGLWASESSIYGRFGYGLAVEAFRTEVDGRAIEFIGDPPPGSVHLVGVEAARRSFPEVYERVRAERPGMLSRNDARWEWTVLHDPEHWREGRSAHRYALFEGESGAEGYAIYRQKSKWDDFPEGEVYVHEILTATPAAHEALWRFLARIDLFPKVSSWNMPFDDELVWRVTDPRRIERKVTDSMWLRILDVPRALEGRGYLGAGRLVLGITDRFLPDNDGTYELEVGPDGAVCRRSNGTPDLELSIETLGSLFLGGAPILSLARAGLIRGTDDALTLAHRLFAWSPAPWCPEDF